MPTLGPFELAVIYFLGFAFVVIFVVIHAVALGLLEAAMKDRK